MKVDGNQAATVTNSPSGDVLKRQTSSSNKQGAAKGSPKLKKNASVQKMNPMQAAKCRAKFHRDEIARLVLWRQPFKTAYYFARELIDLVIFYLQALFSYKKVVIALAMLTTLVTVGFYVEGAHTATLLFLRKQLLWCIYWMGLGIASSIGLGTGLHTFVLYLGPFIAQVRK